MIEHLRDNLPWDDFISEMESEGFVKFPTLTPSDLENIRKSDAEFEPGFIMVVGDPIQSGAIRDVSHLHLLPYIIFRPNTEAQLRKIVISSRKFKISITFAGGKTGLSGGYSNYGIIVDLEDFHSLPKPFTLDLEKKQITAEQGVKVCDLIKWVPYLSNGQFIFPVQPASSLKLPVLVGGIISSNSSGVTSGKLGAAFDWIEKMRVMKPDGNTIEIDKTDPLFAKIVGGNGYYGVILSATLRLHEPSQNLSQAVLFGEDLISAFNGLQSVLDKKVFILVSEFVMSPFNLPEKFASLANLSKKVKKVKWVVLIQGSPKKIDEFIEIMVSNSELSVIKLSESDFQEYMDVRAAMPILSFSGSEAGDFLKIPGFEDVLAKPETLPDIIDTINEVLEKKNFSKVMYGYGHINFRKGQGLLLHIRLPVPVENFYQNRENNLHNITETVYEVNILLRDRHNIVGLKAEHSSGPFQFWLSSEYRNKIRADVKSGDAFYNPHLTIIDDLLIRKIGQHVEDITDLSKIDKNLPENLRKELFTDAMYIYLSG